jgi:hypothetical protein
MPLHAMPWWINIKPCHAIKNHLRKHGCDAYFKWPMVLRDFKTL